MEGLAVKKRIFSSMTCADDMIAAGEAATHELTQPAQLSTQALTLAQSFLALYGPEISMTARDWRELKGHAVELAQAVVAGDAKSLTALLRYGEHDRNCELYAERTENSCYCGLLNAAAKARGIE
jgi:hypothetical protein